jgi:adenosylcobinamide-GDP ribazoletransferase
LAPLGLTDFARATIAGQVVGRAGAVALSATLPAAAPTGSGRVVAGPLPGGAAVAVAVFAALAAVFAAGVWAPLIVTAAGLVVVGLQRVSKARLGGVTGDVLGAATVLAELATLAVAASLY